MAHTTTPMNSRVLRKALNIDTDFVDKHQTPIKEVYPEDTEIGLKIKILTNYYHDGGNLRFIKRERMPYWQETLELGELKEKL